MTPTASVPLDVRLMNLTANLLLLGFVGMGLLAGGRWVAHHPFFAIRGLTVMGDTGHLSGVGVRAQVAPRIQGTFLTIDLRGVRQAFEALPWVRRAVVQREFPNRLRVIVQEHQPVAFWGEEGDSTLVNSYGEVFETNLGEVEQDGLPRLDGPDDQSAVVLAMYRALRPRFEYAALSLQALTLSERGNWQADLSGGAHLELGSGEVAAVSARLQPFLDTVPQVAAHHGRRLDALESADLRYASGYALRLRGVTTVAQGSAPTRN